METGQSKKAGPSREEARSRADLFPSRSEFPNSISNPSKIDVADSPQPGNTRGSPRGKQRHDSKSELKACSQTFLNSPQLEDKSKAKENAADILPKRGVLKKVFPEHFGASENKFKYFKNDYSSSSETKSRTSKTVSFADVSETQESPTEPHHPGQPSTSKGLSKEASRKQFNKGPNFIEKNSTQHIKVKLRKSESDDLISLVLPPVIDNRQMVLLKFEKWKYKITPVDLFIFAIAVFGALILLDLVLLDKVLGWVCFLTGPGWFILRSFVLCLGCFLMRKCFVGRVTSA